MSPSRRARGMHFTGGTPGRSYKRRAKKPFETESDALDHLWNTRGGIGCVYRCLKCDKWHVSTRVAA